MASNWWSKGFLVKESEMLAAEWRLVNISRLIERLAVGFSYKERGVSKLGGPCRAQHVACPDSRGRGLISITFRR